MKAPRAAPVIGKSTLYLPAPIIQVKRHCLACHKLCHHSQDVYVWTYFRKAHLGKKLYSFSNILISCFFFGFFARFILSSLGFFRRGVRINNNEIYRKHLANNLTYVLILSDKSLISIKYNGEHSTHSRLWISRKSQSLLLLNY